MTHGELLEEVKAHAGLRDEAEAERATSAVLATLAERLSRSEADALAEALPAASTPPLREGRFYRDFDLDELYQRVARREQVTLGFAIEHTRSVLQVIAETTSEPLLERLRRALPDGMAALLAPRETSSGDVRAPRQVAVRRDTLAEGQPRVRPLSEAQPVLGHAESVARAANPHADTKLSSSPGLTQEREGETLATGRPGSSRPLSGRS